MIRYIGSEEYEIDTEGFKGILTSQTLNNIIDEFKTRYEYEINLFSELKEEVNVERQRDLINFNEMVNSEDRDRENTVNEFIESYFEEQAFANS